MQLLTPQAGRPNQWAMRIVLRHPLRATALFLLAAGAFSCARTDKCYIEEPRYQRMRLLFERTGSFQRVADAMKDEKWPGCERREFAYRLRKDLFLNPEDFEHVPVGKEPKFSDRSYYMELHEELGGGVDKRSEDLLREKTDKDLIKR